MRGLTFIAPMGYAVVADHPRAKRLENRPRSLPKSMLGVETVIVVHCGMKWSEEYAATVVRIFGQSDKSEKHLRAAANQGGKIIGLMRLTGRQFTDEDPATTRFSLLDNPVVDPWYAGPFAYEISEAIALPEPVPCRGMHGWWPVPDHVMPRIITQVEGWL